MADEYAGDPKAQDMASFAEGMTGECLCGSIRVILTQSRLFTKRNGHMCHCQNCRKWSGCVASNNMVVSKAAVEIEDRKALLKTYMDNNTGSGKVTPRSFCSNCGSSIYSVPTDTDEQYVLPLGIFPRIPAPAFELFAAHKHDWQPHHEGSVKYKFMTSSGEVE